MASVIQERGVFKGGAFILEDQPAADVFTPEDLTDEHRMIAQTAREFMEKEVLPQDEEIEKKNLPLTVDLIRKAAALGLVSIDIPEEYGGLGLDKISSLVISEQMASQGSFTSSLGGHATIGTLPIVYFGTEEQKRRYLPRLATAELIGAYALSESGSGSDALGAKTKAVLSPDGKAYLLTGQKMWITNAGFADLFTVFAKVDGEKFTAFLVEKTFPGFSIAPEEHKMGLNGSSTCALNLEECRVPIENVLGEIGKGHRIAFNILNIGRLKLGIGAVSASKRLCTTSAEYANQRHQFGVPISTFGLVKHKLAEMAIRAYVGECMTYRTMGMIEAMLEGVDHSQPAEVLRCIEEYAVECSIIKVAGSETLDYCADEAVQIFGGNGYSKDYPVERAYRDARINRIFEGTSEINRLIISGQLLRRASKGDLGIFPAARKLMDEMLQPGASDDAADGEFAAEHIALGNAKKIAVAILGSAAQKYRDKVQDQQEILAAASDIIMDVYGMEGSILRTERLIAQRGADQAALQIDATRTFANDAIQRIEASAKRALAAMTEGDELRTMLAVLRRLTRFIPIDTIAARRRIADAIRAAGRYCL